MGNGVPEPHLSAWRGVLNTHASVVGRVEEALADAGLPPLAWYDLLWALRRAPAVACAWPGSPTVSRSAAAD